MWLFFCAFKSVLQGKKNTDVSSLGYHSVILNRTKIHSMCILSLSSVLNRKPPVACWCIVLLHSRKSWVILGLNYRMEFVNRGSTPGGLLFLSVWRGLNQSRRRVCYNPHNTSILWCCPQMIYIFRGNDLLLVSSPTHTKENDHSWKEYHRKFLQVGDKKRFAREQL